MRFLISRLSSLGDVVCTLPAASALKKGFPDCKVVWVVGSKFADIVRCCGAIDEVVEFRAGYRRSDWPELAEPFDGCFDLQGLLKSALPILMSRGKTKLGFHFQREGSFLFSRRVLPDPSSFHVVDQLVDVVRAAGGQADRADFAFAPSGEAMDTVAERLREQGVGKFVILNPGAGWASKRWPEHHCAAFINLAHADNVEVVLIGGRTAEDIAIATRISEMCSDRPKVWTGETNLLELVSLISLATAHVGGDTGSTHIAAALGRPAVGLYSSTNPRRSCPYGQIERCLYDSRSMAAIQPQRAFELAKEALA